MKQKHYFQAIETKFIGPTKRRGSRYCAVSASGERIVISADHALNSDENHSAAAHALANKLDWLSRGNRLVGGGSKNGMSFVLAGKEMFK